MVAGQKRVFIYGNFVDESDRSEHGRTMRLLDQSLATVAIEILREFSATEFIGKIHVLTRDRNWLPVTTSGVSQFEWYKKYQAASRRKEAFYFETEGPQSSDLWQVLYIRQESDDQGSYMAAALKHK